MSTPTVSKPKKRARKSPSSSPTQKKAPPPPSSSQTSSASVAVGVAATRIGNDWGAPEEGEAVEVLKPRPLQKLPSNVKRFLVIQNACGASPSEVVKSVKEVFDLVVAPSTVERYDPTKVGGQTLSLELKTLFREMQREFQTMVVKAGVADQKWRVAKLHMIAQHAFDRGNYKMAMEAMEQVAKEQGGAYTNKSRVEVDDKRSLLAQLLRCNPEDLPAMKAAVDASKIKERAH